MKQVHVEQGGPGAALIANEACAAVIPGTACISGHRMM
jgi:hypothetical protein